MKQTDFVVFAVEGNASPFQESLEGGIWSSLWFRTGKQPESRHHSALDDKREKACVSETYCKGSLSRDTSGALVF